MSLVQLGLIRFTALSTECQSVYLWVSNYKHSKWNLKSPKIPTDWLMLPQNAINTCSRMPQIYFTILSNKLVRLREASSVCGKAKSLSLLMGITSVRKEVILDLGVNV
jgi:hypothetical protein